MKLRQRLFNWFVLALVGLGVLGGIITNYAPFPVSGSSVAVADTLIFLTLYAGLFFMVFGGVVLVGYTIRWLGQRAIYPTDHWPTMRQGALIAIGVTAVFALQGFEVLSAWDAILLVVALALVELSFHTKIVSG